MKINPKFDEARENQKNELEKNLEYAISNIKGINEKLKKFNIDIGGIINRLELVKNKLKSKKYKYNNGENGITYYIYDQKVEIVQRNINRILKPEEIIDLNNYFDDFLDLDHVKFKDLIITRNMLKDIYNNYFHKNK